MSGVKGQRASGGDPGIERGAWAPRVTATVVLAVGIIISVGVARQLFDDAKVADEQRLAAIAHGIMEDLDTRLEKYEAAFQRASDLFYLRQDLPEAPWNVLHESLNLPLNFPALIDFGYAPHLYPSGTNWEYDIATFVAPDARMVRAAKSPNDTLMPVLLLRSAPGYSFTDFGFDLISEDEYRPWVFIDRAFKSAAVRITGRYHSLSTKDGKPAQGVRLYLPVASRTYPAVPPEHDYYKQPLHKSRLTRLKGAVFGTLNVPRLLESIFEDRPVEVALEIFDKPEPGKGQWLASWPPDPTATIPGPRTAVGRLERWEKAPQYGEMWGYHFRTLPLFESQSGRFRGWLVLGSGCALSLLAAGYVHAQGSARQRLEIAAAALRASHDELDRLLHERERLSRDLHDGTLQSIYALGLQLDHCTRLVDADPARASHDLGHVKDTLSEILMETRQFISILSAEGLQSPPMHVALQSMCERMAVPSGMRIATELAAEVSTLLSTEQAAQLLNIAREAIANSLRHSRGDCVTVRLHRHDVHVRLQVSDDGIGFDPADYRLEGHGLRNMLTRARQIEAQIAIDSTRGQGTHIVVDVMPPALPGQT